MLQMINQGLFELFLLQLIDSIKKIYERPNELFKTVVGDNKLVLFKGTIKFLLKITLIF